MRAWKTGVVLLALTWPSLAFSAETITYTYDANGRVITATRSGTVNNGVQNTYTHDDADNRYRSQTTGSP